MEDRVMTALALLNEFERQWGLVQMSREANPNGKWPKIQQQIFEELRDAAERNKKKGLALTRQSDRNLGASLRD